MRLFKPYFSEWLVRQYFSGWWLIALIVILAVSSQLQGGNRHD